MFHVRLFSQSNEKKQAHPQSTNCGLRDSRPCPVMLFHVVLLGSWLVKSRDQEIDAERSFRMLRVRRVHMWFFSESWTYQQTLPRAGKLVSWVVALP